MAPSPFLRGFVVGKYGELLRCLSYRDISTCDRHIHCMHRNASLCVRRIVLHCSNHPLTFIITHGSTHILFFIACPEHLFCCHQMTNRSRQDNKKKQQWLLVHTAGIFSQYLIPNKSDLQRTRIESKIDMFVRRLKRFGK